MLWVPILWLEQQVNTPIFNIFIVNSKILCTFEFTTNLFCFCIHLFWLKISFTVVVIGLMMITLQSHLVIFSITWLVDSTINVAASIRFGINSLLQVTKTNKRTSSFSLQTHTHTLSHKSYLFLFHCVLLCLFVSFHVLWSFLGYVDLHGTNYEDVTLATGYGSYLARPILRNVRQGRPNLSEEEARYVVMYTNFFSFLSCFIDTELYS